MPSGIANNGRDKTKIGQIKNPRFQRGFSIKLSFFSSRQYQKQ